MGGQSNVNECQVFPALVCMYCVCGRPSREICERSFHLKISIPNITILVPKLFCAFIHIPPPIDYIFAPAPSVHSNISQRIAEAIAEPLSFSPLSSVLTSPYAPSYSVEPLLPTQDNIENDPDDVDIQKNLPVPLVHCPENLHAVLNVMSQNKITVSDFIDLRRSAAR